MATPLLLAETKKIPGTCFLSVSERHRWQSENSYSNKNNGGGGGGGGGSFGFRISSGFPVKLDVYLQKINSLINSIDILLKAATSSPSQCNCDCRRLFAFDHFAVTPLPRSITSKTPRSRSSSVPRSSRTAKDWETVLEKALAYTMGPTRPFLLLDLDVVERDAAYMTAQQQQQQQQEAESINLEKREMETDLVDEVDEIHPETNLQLHIFRTEQEQENPKLPKRILISAYPNPPHRASASTPSSRRSTTSTEPTSRREDRMGRHHTILGGFPPSPSQREKRS